MKRLFAIGPLASLPACILLLACVTLLNGCGKFFQPVTGGCTSDCTSTTDFLYVANQKSTGAGVAGFTLSSTALTAVPNTPFGLDVLPTALAVNPLNTFLYVGSSDGPLYLYAINSDGSLAIQNSGSPVASVAAASIAVDATGSWLLVADSVTAAVTVFAIDPTTGLLTASTSGPVVVNNGAGFPAGIVITPSNGFVYVSLETKGVEVLTFDPSTGTLTDTGANLAPLGASNSDQGMAVDPGSAFLFVTETGVNALRVLKIGADGGLTQVGSPTATGLGPSAVMVDASGSYVYVTNRTANTISAFLLTNGSLTAIAGSPFAAGNNPVSITEDSSKTYVAVVSAGGSPDLQIFTFDTTTAGKLDSFATAATGTDPTVPVAVAATH